MIMDRSMVTRGKRSEKNGQPQRLTPLGLIKACYSLICFERCRGESEAVLPPDRNISGHESNSIITNSQNQDPVLNETAELLGLSLRMTEDQLTRDMLASTASIYNCTGGTNGKIVAVLKSSLMDLEAYGIC